MSKIIKYKIVNESKYSFDDLDCFFGIMVDVKDHAATNKKHENDIRRHDNYGHQDSEIKLNEKDELMNLTAIFQKSHSSGEYKELIILFVIGMSEIKKLIELDSELIITLTDDKFIVKQGDFRYSNVEFDKCNKRGICRALSNRAEVDSYNASFEDRYRFRNITDNFDKYLKLRGFDVKNNPEESFMNFDYKMDDITKALKDKDKIIIAYYVVAVTFLVLSIYLLWLKSGKKITWKIIVLVLLLIAIMIHFFVLKN